MDICTCFRVGWQVPRQATTFAKSLDLLFGQKSFFTIYLRII